MYKNEIINCFTYKLLCSCHKKTKYSCNYTLCLCGYCNHCHIGGICPDLKYWYEKYNSIYKERQPILPGQCNSYNSIPDCFNHNYYD